jgi:CheY-like chemotaxis protein
VQFAIGRKIGQFLIIESLSNAAGCGTFSPLKEPQKSPALIAHEINNPLATVIANLELVDREIAAIATELDIRDRMQEVIEEVRDARASAYRLREIVRDLQPPATGPFDAFTRSSEAAPTPRRGKILVIDDEPMVARSLGRVLEQDHDVTIVLDAGDAHQRVVAGERFDVILCDLMMPKMTGMDLHAELLRAVPEQAAQMVFLTGGAFTPHARAFLEGVPNHRLHKPFDTQELRSLVNDRVR